MEHLSSDAYSLGFRAYPIYEKGGVAVRADAHLEVVISDADIKRQLPGFDGLERLRVVVPGRPDEQLGYAGTRSVRSCSRDIYGVVLHGVDLTALLVGPGVDVYMDTNVGTVLVARGVRAALGH